MVEMLFGVKGRIRRSTYWLYALGASIAMLVVIFIGAMLAAMDNPLRYLGILLMVAAYVVLIWAGIALYIMRLHDRDMTWAWIFCPVYPQIVAMFLDGTPGPNKYGPSPKGLTGPAPITPVT